MKIRKAVKFNGTDLNQIFSLPCVESIEKGEKGTPYVRIYPSATNGRLTATNGRLTATTGDVLVEFDNDMWQVFGQAAYDRLGSTL